MKRRPFPDINLVYVCFILELFIACEEGFGVIVKLLLENGAELQTNENGWSPFFIACLEGHADVVEFLFQYQSETWECDNDTMRSPLFVACKEGNIDVVDLLLQNKADVNQVDIRKWSPLHVKKGDHPFSLVCSSAPFSSSSLTISPKPSSHAMNRGDSPCPSNRLRSHSYLNKTFTISL
jgi:hypothetical protein